MADKLEPLAVRPSEAARLVDVSRTTFSDGCTGRISLSFAWAVVRESPWMVCGNGLQSNRR